MSTFVIPGFLEIDPERGVIYFHSNNEGSKGTSLLRIQGLPAPIPNPEKTQMLDIRMSDVNRIEGGTTAFGVVSWQATALSFTPLPVKMEEPPPVCTLCNLPMSYQAFVPASQTAPEIRAGYYCADCGVGGV